MRTGTILAITILLTTAPAFAQNAGLPGAANPAPMARAPGSSAAPARPTPGKSALTVSTPESRSAAALALSHEPTFDEGTAQRIREAALSYSDIAVRGGWPLIPPHANFAVGAAGGNDDLLRKRLIVSGDLAEDKASGPFDDTVAQAVKRF